MSVRVLRLRADARLPAPCAPGCAKLGITCPERFALAGPPGAPGLYPTEAFVPTGLAFRIPAGFRGFLVRSCRFNAPGVQVVRTRVEDGEEAFVRLQVLGAGPLVLEAGAEVGALLLEPAAPPGILEAQPA